MDLKRNALNKFIVEDISKLDYDDFISIVQDKLQLLEIEKAEIKKEMAEYHATSKISTIVEQLKEFLNFNSLTTEMLLRFVAIKIYYKFAQVEGF